MKYIQAALYGIIFGIANIIPSVSGGTMMVVFGCYDKVCDALALDFKHIKKNLDFLIPFAIGAAIGLVGFSFVMSYLFENFPLPSNMFFIGLILGSIPLLIRTATKKQKFTNSNIIPLLLALAVVVLLTVLSGQKGEEYTVTQSRSATTPNTYIVRITNDTNQTIGNWSLQFDEGEVKGVGGATLHYEAGMRDTLASIFSGEQEHQPNTIRPVEGENELKPHQTYSFTYTPTRTKVEFEEKMEYNMSFVLLINLLVGGFVAAVAMIIPGVSGSFMLVLFGVYATILAAIKNFNLLILLPAGIGILFGLVIGAKLIKWLLERYHGMVYSIIIGLVIGSIYALFPKELKFDIQMVIGIATMIVGGALSLTLGMEKKSNEEESQVVSKKQGE